MSESTKNLISWIVIGLIAVLSPVFWSVGEAA